MRHLYLLRHAQSNSNDPSIEDIQRPLSPKGHSDARKLAGYLRHQDFAIELVLCSSAERTTQTLEEIRPALPRDTKVSIEKALYTFDPSKVAERLSEVSPNVHSVMIVGHSPAIQTLAAAMTPDASLRERIGRSYPTCALTILTLESGSWNLAVASEVSFVAPEELD